MREVCRGPARPDLVRQEDLASLLEHQAKTAPEQTALIAGTQSLSYGQLHRHACHLAAQLHALGQGPGCIVGLWMPRGMDALIAQAGLAMAGAAWLPFDADTPPERIADCLADANAGALIAPQGWAERLPSTCSGLIQPYGAMVSTQPRPFERQLAAPQDPAYVIYTSGSTGKPKGIAVSQGSICHFLRSENELLGVRGDDRVYQGFSLAFD
ncbi:MAG: AMP-binding protein, partial [Paucibacter sp.]|nr:AMP-binding protein [Roseateles sp.]